MQTNEQTSKQYFKSLKIVHIALMLGQVFFASIAFFVNSMEPMAMTELNEPFLVIVTILIFGSLMAGKMISKRKLASAKQMQNLSDKLNDYRALIIIRLALLEIPVFFAIISYLLIGNLVFLGLASLILIIFIFQAPTQDKLIDELDLNYAETNLIEDPEAIVAIVKIN